MREVLEYDNIFNVVLEFIEELDMEGVLVVMSDYEMGGLLIVW